ncbi:MAG: hypothetical protein HKM93_05505 [Desulfobacteraceae bacterium]|nr:hypothetical protein [Desulfobacteraceae bacterium]
MNTIIQQQWLIIGIVFFGIVFYISLIRYRDKRWIDKRFGSDTVRAMSFGVNYFGRATEKGAPRKSSGFLLLLSDRLFFRSRLARLELDIPAKSIQRVYHGSDHKGVDLHQSVMKIDFLTVDHRQDTAAFKVPYPPQWISAIRNTLIKQAS